MKKVLLVAVAGLFVLASCKKDYTCACTLYGETINTTYKAKKVTATASCNSLDLSYKAEGGSCSLK